MIGKTHWRFWKLFDALPPPVQKLLAELALYRAQRYDQLPQPISA